MGIQVIGAGGVVAGAGEEASKPLHIVNMPMSGNVYRYSGFTGTIAAATAANSEVLQFRFVSGTKSYAIVLAVLFDGLGIVAVSTAAGPLGFHLTPARVWTGIGTGGTRIAQTGDNLQLRTSEPNSQVTDLGIATTAGLTAGTKTLDANSIGQAIGGVGSALVTSYGPSSLIMPQPLLDARQNMDSPLVLANQEGFVIRTTHAGPTALTYVAGFTVVWAEVTEF